MADDEVRIEHPNRKKASSKITRLLVIVMLLVTVGLMLIVTLGGWAALVGAKPVGVALILVFAILAFFVGRWSRGVLPLIAALAMITLIFAAVSTPAWFNRDHTGYNDPALPSGLLGLITALLVPVELLLIAVAMSGFRQAWNVEVEHKPDEPERPERPPHRGDREPDTERLESDRGQRPEAGSGPSPAPA
jgi:hypothetical protein